MNNEFCPIGLLFAYSAGTRFTTQVTPCPTALPAGQTQGTWPPRLSLRSRVRHVWRAARRIVPCTPSRAQRSVVDPVRQGFKEIHHENGHTCHPPAGGGFRTHAGNHACRRFSACTLCHRGNGVAGKASLIIHCWCTNPPFRRNLGRWIRLMLYA